MLKNQADHGLIYFKTAATAAIRKVQRESLELQLKQIEKAKENKRNLAEGEKIGKVIEKHLIELKYLAVQKFISRF